ncbi:hypothetical protein GXP67_07195 [Rhodocytophaga rosea]|uniref:Uncharacterized protein n=1 Tax=Rhodocytophaga rosea TaxID=2704465 RepID=A0A6C0GF74_9BACT|nr:hypothetical protein [Rhodocytophaga rosea]QHT66454.1 hypothetical protein GXP67_07195 [Rhodocytophaga rosea]
MKKVILSIILVCISVFSLQLIGYYIIGREQFPAFVIKNDHNSFANSGYPKKERLEIVVWPNLNPSQKKKINNILASQYKNVVFIDKRIKPSLDTISEDRYYNSLFLVFESHPRVFAKTGVKENISYGDYVETHFSEYYWCLFKWVKISREMKSQS